MLEKWTNTSSPCSREMKPKPFSALKNFTVPVAKPLSLHFIEPVLYRTRRGRLRDRRPDNTLLGTEVHPYDGSVMSVRFSRWAAGPYGTGYLAARSRRIERQSSEHSRM